MICHLFWFDSKWNKNLGLGRGWNVTMDRNAKLSLVYTVCLNMVDDHCYGVHSQNPALLFVLGSMNNFVTEIAI